MRRGSVFCNDRLTLIITNSNLLIITNTITITISNSNKPIFTIGGQKPFTVTEKERSQDLELGLKS